MKFQIREKNGKYEIFQEILGLENLDIQFPAVECCSKEVFPSALAAADYIMNRVKEPLEIFLLYDAEKYLYNRIDEVFLPRGIRRDGLKNFKDKRVGLIYQNMSYDNTMQEFEELIAKVKKCPLHLGK